MVSGAEEGSRRPRSGWRSALIALAAIGALAAVDVAVRGGVESRRNVTGSAEWIWDEPAPAGRDKFDVPADPAAFYALDDFEVAEPPASAELQIRAEEEYIVWLNGVFLGGAAYRDAPAGSVDVYEVGPLLRAGQNRVVVEVRSRRASGGLLCRVVTTGEREPIELTATGPEWRIEPTHVDALLMPGGAGGVGGDGAAEATAEPTAGVRSEPYVWGRPPIGRWGSLVDRREQPDRSERLAGSTPTLAQSWSRWESENWKPARAPRQRPRPRGPWVTFDFGRVVEGHLVLHRAVPFDSVETVPGRALVLFGTEPPDARAQAEGEEPADEVALFVPRSSRWLSARPFRFRYATVLGLDSISTAEVYELGERGGAPVDSPVDDGVFELAPPLLRTSVEHEVRRELEDVLGVAAR